jgi:hypothetical protein
MKAYDLQTIDNPSLIKRFSHRRRFEVATRLLDPQPGETVLDYGTGDARLLMHLHQQQPTARYWGYEPVAEMHEQAQALLQQAGVTATLLASRDELRSLRPDKVSCMEVLEHLDEPRLIEVFADFRALLAQGKSLMLSVPIEVGPTALAKNAVRVATGQAQESTSFGNVMKLAFGDPARVPRISRGGYIDSHLGFDYRRLRRRLPDEGFVVEREVFSPLPLLQGVVNSQVFWICRRR